MKIRIFLILFLVPFVLLAGQDELDSLENLIPNKQGSEKVKLLNDLSWEYGPSDNNKSKMYGNQALKLATEIADSSLIAASYKNLGIVFYRNSNYDSAIIVFLQSLAISRRNGTEEFIARLNSNIGAAYQELGMSDLSVKYQLDAVRFFEESHDSIKMSQCYTNLARVYYENNEYDKSIPYNEKALEVFIHYDYKYGMATAYGSQALNYQETGEMEKAITYLEKALEIFKILDYKVNIATALLNLGQLHRELGNTPKGMDYYYEAIELAKEVDDPHTLTVASANLAYIMLQRGKYMESEKLYLEALKTSQEIKVLKTEHQCYKGLATLYDITGQYKEAFEFRTKQYLAHDSLYNIEKYEQLSELETKYETEKKEQEIELLKVEDKVKLLTIKRQQIFIIGSVTGIILLVIIASLWYNRKRLQQKATMETEKNKYRKKLLESTIDAEEKERKRIARELHDGVAQQLGGLKIAWQVISKEYKGKGLEKLKEITKTLDEATDEVRNISHQMMPKVLSTNGLVYAIEDMLEKTFKYSSIKYQFEHFGTEGRFKEKIELSLYRICQELVNNVIKHSGANFISVQLFKSKKHLILMLEDNGKGMNSDNNKPGIGFLNIASRIDTINGEVNYEPGPETGTVATIRVPLEVAEDFGSK
ncbi:MAG: hypothetical protein DRJ05_10690 [Bacteroidetes bacterium]|nr:MAG: hypothetical protein DRJ05_10690 [Bacteroidota bacterium]